MVSLDMVGQMRKQPASYWAKSLEYDNFADWWVSQQLVDAGVEAGDLDNSLVEEPSQEDSDYE